MGLYHRLQNSRPKRSVYNQHGNQILPHIEPAKCTAATRRAVLACAVDPAGGRANDTGTCACEPSFVLALLCFMPATHTDPQPWKFEFGVLCGSVVLRPGRWICGGDLLMSETMLAKSALPWGSATPGGWHINLTHSALCLLGRKSNIADSVSRRLLEIAQILVNKSSALGHAVNKLQSLSALNKVDVL